MADIPVCFAGSKATAANLGTTNVVTVGSAFDGSPAAFPVVAGETVIVCGGAGTHLPSAIADSAGNSASYAQAAGIATSPASWIWAAPNVAHALHAAGTGFTADTVTVTTTSGDGKQAVVLSVPGLTSTPVDSGSAATSSGTSASPSVTSGALGQAREFIVAVCTSVKAAGEAQWPVPWQVIAKGVQTSTGAWCSVAVLRNYTGTAAVTAGPSLAASGDWTMSICGFKGAAASLRSYVGASVSDASFTDHPGSWGAALEWDADLGRAPMAQRTRIFYLQSGAAWGTTLANDPQNVAGLCTAHPSMKPVVSVKPNRMGLVTPSIATSEIAGMCGYVTMLRNNGVKEIRYAPWNEPQLGGGSSSFGDGSNKKDDLPNNPWRVGGPVPPPPTGWTAAQSASHYQAWCNLYMPSLQLSGGLICYKPAVSSYLTTILFFPGASWRTGAQANNAGGCHELILDIYATDPFKDHINKTEALAEQLTRGTLANYQGVDFRFAPAMGFGFGELGVTDGTVPDDTVPGWTAHWFNNVSATSFGGTPLVVPGVTKRLVDRMAAGYPLAPMVWFAEKPPPAGNAIDGQGRIAGRADIGDAVRAFYDAVSVDAATTGTPPAVSTTSLPAGQVGVPYSFQLQATGGTAPLAWSVTSGALNPGLTLHSSGLIDGSPTAAGSPSIGFTVTDAASLSGSATLTLTVAGSTLTVPAQTLPAATVGVPYSAQLVATGGQPPDTWATIAGSLPAGLTLTSGGAIGGTPTTAGTSSFTPQVTDHLGGTASRALSITVGAAVFRIVSSLLPPGVLTESYTGQIDTANATGNVTWAITAGVLPPGLALATTAPSDPNLTDESGAHITDEAGTVIYDESGP